MPDRDGDRVCPVAGAELIHNMSKVGLDSLFADEHNCADVAVTVAG